MRYFILSFVLILLLVGTANSVVLLQEGFEVPNISLLDIGSGGVWTTATAGPMATVPAPVHAGTFSLESPHLCGNSYINFMGGPLDPTDPAPVVVKFWYYINNLAVSEKKILLWDGGGNFCYYGYDPVNESGGLPFAYCYVGGQWTGLTGHNVASQPPLLQQFWHEFKIEMTDSAQILSVDGVIAFTAGAVTGPTADHFNYLDVGATIGSGQNGLIYFDDVFWGHETPVEDWASY